MTGLLPVFQMVIEEDDDGTISLSFSTEQAENIQPCFVIPLKPDRDRISDSYYLPGEIYRKPVNFTLHREDNFFVLNGNGLLHTIRFRLFYPETGFLSDDRSLPLNEFIFTYKGTHNDLVFPYTQFMIITPVDLLIMDELYRQQKACFVGLTPAFGTRFEQEFEGDFTFTV